MCLALSYLAVRVERGLKRSPKTVVVAGADALSTTTATELIATQRGEKGDGPTGGGA